MEQFLETNSKSLIILDSEYNLEEINDKWRVKYIRFTNIKLFCDVEKNPKLIIVLGNIDKVDISRGLRENWNFIPIFGGQLLIMKQLNIIKFEFSKLLH